MNIKGIIILCLIASTLCAQNKQMKKAVRQGSDNQGLYEAEFKKPMNSTKVKSWCTENGYVLIGFVEGNISRFGNIQNGILGAKFMTQSHYNYLAHQETERRNNSSGRNSSSSNSDVSGYIKAAAIVGGIWAAWQGTKWVANKALGAAYSGGESSYIDGNESKEPCYSVTEWETGVQFGWSWNNKTQIVKCHSNGRKKKLMYIGEANYYDVTDHYWQNIKSYSKAIKFLLNEINCNCD